MNNNNNNNLKRGGEVDVPAMASAEPSDFSRVTNADVCAAAFHKVPDGAYAAICTKAGDPNEDGWPASRADAVIGKLSATKNNYANCSSFYPDKDGAFTVRKSQFAACHFLMLDDLGTKNALERLGGFELSWLIETSPGNFQGGIILAEPITDGDVAVRLLNAIIAAGLCDAGASGPLSRWARSPVGINGKQKYADATGVPFQCRLVKWRPDRRYTPQEIVDGLKLELASTAPVVKTSIPANSNQQVSSAEYPDADANKIADACQQIGLFRDTKGAGQSEPLWRDCLGIVGHCADGEITGHEWSSGHKKYREAETDKKLAYRLKIPPTTCAQFRTTNAEGCIGCKQRCRSPITLGWPAWTTDAFSAEVSL